MPPSRLPAPAPPASEPPGPGDAIVISGMSGRFPECDSVQEFADQLFAGVDLVTEDDRRWPTGLYGLPTRNGKLRDLARFDAPFFGVHAKQARTMDPQLRLLLEVAHEAIVDAGLNPAELRGSRTGVFVGSSGSEADAYWTDSSQREDHLTPEEGRGDARDDVMEYAMIGCWRCMLANRLSFAFDLKGPSLALDTACSSGMVALHEAAAALLRGECDAALVATSNLLLRPTTAVQLQRLGMLSAEGKCRAFDASNCGFVRSEAVVAVLLQRAPSARRVYAAVLGTGTCADGYGEEGFGFPSGASQAELARRVCAEAGVDPRKDVTYVEAHGTGTKAGDPQEAGGIAAVFCGGADEAASCRRGSPLLIGSVKSNMGHAEAASGLVSIVKVLVSMERGELPANLHFEKPNQDIPALHDGRLKVVNRNHAWGGGVAAVNSMGFGGSDAHVLLRSNPRGRQVLTSHQGAAGVRQSKSTQRPLSATPKLIVVSGRTQEAVDHLLDEAEAKFDDNEFHALLAAVHHLDVKGHTYRGYTVLSEATGGPSGMRESGPSSSGRPVWWVFPGMGCQWPSMARSMMVLPPFAEAVGRCAAALKPHGFDLVDVLVNAASVKQGDNDPEGATNAFVSIAAVQVALVDTLRALGIHFDGILGHSAGEMGCAYADGVLSAEETVLSAFWRGRCAREVVLPPGRMAAIGLSWEEVKRRCPPDVFPACHNAADSVTVSGSPESVSAFVASLKEEGIFAKEVDSCGLAFHSQYVSDAGPWLLERLEELLPPDSATRPRSHRWISTSFPEEDWGSPLARNSSAAYQVHSVLSPVLFAEALAKVPEDAIVVEVAPHHLMQAVLRRAKGSSVSCIGLMRKDHPDNLAFFTGAIGKLYNAGAQPQTAWLLPAVEFPVSRGTPSLSSMIRWDHSAQWEVPDFCGRTEDSRSGLGGQGAVFNVDVNKDAYKYLIGHNIDGRVIFPASGYLYLVWRTFAKMHCKSVDDFAVVIEDVRFHRATILPRDGASTGIKFYVNVMEGTGRFEVCEGGSLAASGRISVPEDAEEEFMKDSPQPPPSGEGGDNGEGERGKFRNNSTDVGKELRLRGCRYSGPFCGIVHWVAGERSGTYAGQLRWGAGEELPQSEDDRLHQRPWSKDSDWVPFLDTMLQICALALPGRQLILPTALRKVVLDPCRHRRIVEGNWPPGGGIPVLYSRDVDVVGAGGVKICGVQWGVAQRRWRGKDDPTLEKYVFVPYENLRPLDCEDGGRSRHSALAVVLQIASENLTTPRMKVVEVSCAERPHEQLLLPNVVAIIDKMPQLLTDITVAVVPEDVNAAAETIAPLSEWLAERFVMTQTMSRTVEGVIPVVDPSASTHLLVLAVSESTRVGGVGGDALVWRNLMDSVQPGGFVLLEKEEKENLGTLPSKLVLVAEQPFVYEGRSPRKFVLLRKQLDCLADAAPQPVVVPVTYRHFGWVERLKRALGLKRQDDANPGTEVAVVLVSQSDDFDSGVLGLVNCLRRELGPGIGNVQAVLIQDAKAPVFSLDGPLYAKQMTKGLRFNVLSAGGVWGSYRHIPVDTASSACLEVEQAYLDTLVRGDLSSLRWIEAPPLVSVTGPPELGEKTPSSMPEGKTSQGSHKLRSGKSAQRELCSVDFAALNFKDIMLATGKLSVHATDGHQDCVLGLEFSGRDKIGRRVMGMVSSRALATAVLADPAFLWEVPDTWTLQEAATVPVCYSTAYYALAVRGRMRRGEALLIHSGAGGVGQAAIALALGSGCSVFTTVGSREKRDFLLRTFPRLAQCGGRSVIVRARDPDCKLGCYPSACSFELHVLSETRGRGVDLVLNSLAGEALLASARCLARHGRFLEIGKVDLAADSPLGMGLFLRNSSFHGVFLDALTNTEDAGFDREEVSRLIREGVRSGVVRPLPVTVFRAHEAEKAFRFMTSGKHIGKVILQVREEQEDAGVKVATSTRRRTAMTPLSVVPRTYMHPHKTYVLVGGLGGLGLELADWLVLRGARRLVLASRSGLRSGYQALRVRRWREEAGVDVLVWSGDGKGCDTERGASELLAEASRMGPVGGIFNLAAVLRDAYLENLTEDDFTAVILSKIHCTAALDRASRQLCPELDLFVCFSSAASGWGNAGQCNYGLANSAMERLCEARQQAGLPGVAIQWGAVGDAGLVAETVLSKGMDEEDVEIGGTVPQRISSCLAALDVFLRLPRPPAVLSSMVPAPKDRHKQQQSSGSVTAVEAVAKILGITNVKTASSSQTLADLGLDSIMVTEVKQVLERSYDIFLSNQEIRRLTIGKLGSLSESGALS